MKLKAAMALAEVLVDLDLLEVRARPIDRHTAEVQFFLRVLKPPASNLRIEPPPREQTVDIPHEVVQDPQLPPHDEEGQQ